MPRAPKSKSAPIAVGDFGTEPAQKEAAREVAAAIAAGFGSEVECDGHNFVVQAPRIDTGYELLGGGPLAEVADSPVGGVYPAIDLPPAYVGSTGIRLDGVCGNCDGDGVLATTNRAATHPEKYPDEIVKCGSCGGLGGRTAEDGARGRAASEAYKAALFGDEAVEGVSLAGVPDGNGTPPGHILVQVPEDEYAALLEKHARVAAELESVRRALVAKPLPSRPTTCEETATRILAEDPRTALALYRRVSRGYGLAEWRPLGAGAQLVDLGTGDMLALVAPEGRSFVASYVESGTNLAGPMADTLDACKDAVGNRMQARGVGVL